ncbi:MAG: hypothetical protein E7313_07790 [Clostridiales bacterium]|nr:hypothetical protein [Clostridiales bacterium]
MATRILVTGMYINPSTYVLYNEDGTEFQVIKEGEGFQIGNQLRLWYPIRIAKKSGKGTILMCQKFGNDGHIIEEFPLIHNKKGLWALTSGAARNGVFHCYHEPQSELEKQLSEMGISRNVITKIDSIDVEMTVGGKLCSHCTENNGFWYITDGESEDLTKPEYAPMTHSNQYHRGCMVSTYQTRIFNASYVIHYSIGTYMNGCRHRNVLKVLITPNADETKIIEKLKNLKI